jgi:UDP-N-acetylglucosamine 2-epimerase (non-hydrolysing)
MAPLYHQLSKVNGISVVLCITSQHREMLDQVLCFFEIVPDIDLNLMLPNQTLNALSSNILSKMDEVLKNENPDLVLVHGDTTTSSMVAIAAFHRNIRVGHVEAGLRTFNKKAPFPEEINRQITGRIADFHFAPTKLAKQNLLKEGVKNEAIIVTGNTVIDALIWAKKKIDKGYKHQQINELQSKLSSSKLVLVTGHRRENFGQGFINFCNALLEIAKNKDVEIVFPVHLNPNVQEPVKKMLSSVKNIHLIAPVEYPVMVWLMQKASLIISDSGGIQEEAPTFNKQILVTREVSERPEGVASGYSVLVGTNTELIVEKANYFLNNIINIETKNPYGDGKASQKIIKFLLKNI